MHSQVWNDSIYRRNSISDILSDDVRLSIHFCFKVLNTLQNNMRIILLLKYEITLNFLSIVEIPMPLTNSTLRWLKWFPSLVDWPEELQDILYTFFLNLFFVNFIYYTFCYFFFLGLLNNTKLYLSTFRVNLFALNHSVTPFNSRL